MTATQSQCPGATPRLRWRALWFWITIILLTHSPSAFCDSATLNAGFFFDRFKLTLEPGERTEAVGPFFYQQTDELARTWALPPLISKTILIDGDACEYDFAYPLLTYDRFGSVYRWQLGQLLAFAGGDDQEENTRRRFTLFPFYFQQHSPDTNQNYTAVFPFYGHLKNRIFRSEIDFVLWPLYVKTIKRAGATTISTEETDFTRPLRQWLDARRGDVTTHNFLLPFFHVRYGDGLFGWQAWPLIGNEKKVLTVKTNTWGDAENIPGHHKFFAAWPFYFQQHVGVGSENPSRQLLVFPFYNRLRSPLRDSTSYLTPLGVTITDDRARKYREVGVPWPFIDFAWGEGKTIHRVWPVFSRAHTKDLESNFYLWPAYTYRRMQGETLERERTRMFYFLFSHTSEKNTETAATKTRTDLWPLFTRQEDFAGRSRLQILALLEPILPASKSIERNYSPLWSLWRSENNPNSGGSSQSLLWNLFRHEVVPAPKPVLPTRTTTTESSGNLLSMFSATRPAAVASSAEPVFASPLPPTRKTSLLFGLFQYQSTGENRQWRIFYLPLKSSQKAPAHVPEHR